MKRLFPVMVAILLISSLLAISCSSATPAPSTSTAPAPTTSAAPPPVKTTATAAPSTSAAPPATTPAAPATSAAAQTKTYKFSYNNFFAPTSLYSILAEMWCAEITKRTNGAVTFSYLPGASLTASNKVYDGVINGISDIGFSVVAYTVGRFPLTELIDYPQGYPSGYVATMVTNDFYNQYKPPEFNDVHMLYFQATGPQVLLLTKTYVSKLENVKGLILRSTGVGANIATALGATGYAASQPEAYELMSKGVIHGSIAPREVLLGWKQAEVVKFVTECYDIGSVSNMYIVMNKNKWDALPPDIQKVFTDVSQQWIEYHAKVSADYDRGGMEYFKSQQGRVEVNLTPEESARWVAAVQPLVSKAISDVKAKGLPGDEAEKYIKDRIQYWKGKTPSDADLAQWVKDNVKKP